MKQTEQMRKQRQVHDDADQNTDPLQNKEKKQML